MTDNFTIGVEEEFPIVDAETLELRPRAERIAARATALVHDQIEMELHLAQIETPTPICASLDEFGPASAGCGRRCGWTSRRKGSGSGWPVRANGSARAAVPRGSGRPTSAAARGWSWSS